ncbi:MAG: NUDIX hydrolase [Marmoricola sp.]
MRYALPETLVEQARAFSEGDAEPATPRNAATVVLTRPGANGPEVYLLRRQASMAFAAGFCVFPGGGVDERDFEAHVDWAGPSVEQWAAQLDTDAATARALVCAAVRETFEESGVLLAGPSADEVVSDTTAADWEADRVALEAREFSFSEFLERRGLVLRSDLLVPWSAWLTPIFEPKRYRTWFFAAALPEGQRTRDVSSESSSVTWMEVGDAADQVESKQMMMLPPTYFTCLQVARFDSPEAVLADARDRHVQMFMPEVISDGDEFVLSRPAWAIELLEARG